MEADLSSGYSIVLSMTLTATNEQQTRANVKVNFNEPGEGTTLM